MVLPYQAVLAAAAQSWVRSAAAALTSSNASATAGAQDYSVGDFRVSVNESAPSFEVFTSAGAEVWKSESFTKEHWSLGFPSTFASRIVQNTAIGIKETGLRLDNCSTI